MFETLLVFLVNKPRTISSESAFSLHCACFTTSVNDFFPPCKPRLLLNVDTNSQITFTSNSTHPSAIVVDPTAEVLVHIDREPFNYVIDILSQILFLRTIHC